VLSEDGIVEGAVQIAAILAMWPAVGCSLAAGFAAVMLGRQGLAYASAALATPFSLYFNGMPPLRYAVLLFPLLLVGGGLALRRRRRALAAALMAPFAVFAIWVAYRIFVVPPSTVP
jgi:hypothetical protein